MKKTLLTLILGISLSGCATGHGYYSPVNPINGAIIGGAIGNALSTGNRGAATAAGAVIGTIIGSDIQSRNMQWHHQHRQQYYYQHPHTYYHSSCKPANYCSVFYYPHEREACLRGVYECRSNENRMQFQQSIDAYNYGRN